MVQIGSRVPNGALKFLESGQQRWVDTRELFDGRKVVLFSCPGAFTVKSTELQVPSYLQFHDRLCDLGVDEIICISVNDPFVMKAWAEHCKVDGKIRMLGDAHCEYHTALGLEMDCTRFTLGWRSQRFSMYIEDGLVRELNVEVPGDYKVSDASVIYAQLEKHAG